MICTWFAHATVENFRVKHDIITLGNLQNIPTYKKVPAEKSFSSAALN